MTVRSKHLFWGVLVPVKCTLFFSLLVSWLSIYYCPQIIYLIKYLSMNIYEIYYTTISTHHSQMFIINKQIHVFSVVRSSLLPHKAATHLVLNITLSHVNWKWLLQLHILNWSHFSWFFSGWSHNLRTPSRPSWIMKRQWRTSAARTVCPPLTTRHLCPPKFPSCQSGHIHSAASVADIVL